MLGVVILSAVGGFAAGVGALAAFNRGWPTPLYYVGYADALNRRRPLFPPPVDPPCRNWPLTGKPRFPRIEALLAEDLDKIPPPISEAL